MRAKKLSTLIILLFTAALASAAARLVPGQYPNIQAAIDDCKYGDTVIVAPGTYTGPGNRDIDFRGKRITVRSTDPNAPTIVAATVIDCNGGPGDYHRGFNFHTGEDANSIVAGFTIANGYTAIGGAIYCTGEPRPWTDPLGPRILNCVITQNSATVVGGAIYIAGNRPTINNCTISANQCLGLGQGQSSGGGIACSGASPAISNCTITDNKVTYGSGGGIYCVASNALIANCTITENVAEFRGGALYFGYQGKPTINNSILYFNTAPGGPEIALDSYYHDPSLLNLAVSYTNVRGGLPAIYNPGGATISWGAGNIDVEPYFVDVNNGDYHLKSGGWRWDAGRRTWTWDTVTSRCIDGGDPDAPLRDELLFVPVDPTGYWSVNLRIDMGAYGGTAEASIPPHGWAIRTDYSNDGITNFTDFGEWSGNRGYSLAESVSDSNSSPAFDFAQFAPLAADWLNQTTWFRLPGQATSPNPPDGSVGIRLDPVLSWEAGTGATSHDVYFGTSDPPTFRVSTTARTFAPGYLSLNTTYYWRIDEVNSFGRTAGPVWTFTTGTGSGGR